MAFARMIPLGFLTIGLNAPTVGWLHFVRSVVPHIETTFFGWHNLL